MLYSPWGSPDHSLRTTSLQNPIYNTQQEHPTMSQFSKYVQAIHQSAMYRNYYYIIDIMMVKIHINY